jgi:hypothetical protein
MTDTDITKKLIELIQNSDSFEDFFQKSGIVNRRQALLVLLENLSSLQKVMKDKQ